MGQWRRCSGGGSRPGGSHAEAAMVARCRGLLDELWQKVTMVATPAGLCKANRMRGEV
jgi:hypothetical protein